MRKGASKKEGAWIGLPQQERRMARRVRRAYRGKRRSFEGLHAGKRELGQSIQNLRLRQGFWRALGTCVRPLCPKKNLKFYRNVSQRFYQILI